MTGLWVEVECAGRALWLVGRRSSEVEMQNVRIGGLNETSENWNSPKSGPEKVLRGNVAVWELSSL